MGRHPHSGLFSFISRFDHHLIPPPDRAPTQLTCYTPDLLHSRLVTLEDMRPKAIFFDVGGTLIFPDLPELMAPLLRRGIQPTAEQIFIADRAAKHLHTRHADDAPGNLSHWYVYFSSLLDQI